MQALHRCASLSLPGVSVLSALAALATPVSSPLLSTSATPPLLSAPAPLKGRIELLQDLAAGEGRAASNHTHSLFTHEPAPLQRQQKRVSAGLARAGVLSAAAAAGKPGADAALHAGVPGRIVGDDAAAQVSADFVASDALFSSNFSLPVASVRKQDRSAFNVLGEGRDGGNSKGSEGGRVGRRTDRKGGGRVWSLKC
jgi:hypothetical protein